MAVGHREFPLRDVIIVGGGYGALSAALALHKIGVSSLVLEKSPAARQEGFSIGAWSNAWRALEELGVADAVRNGHIAQTKVHFADSDQNVYKELRMQELPPLEGMDINEFRVIRRSAVPSAIGAALPTDTIHYGCKILRATVTPTGMCGGYLRLNTTLQWQWQGSNMTDATFPRGAEVELEGGQKLTAKLVILADGVHSKSAAKYHKQPLRVMDIGGWRAIVEVDCEDEDQAATISNGANVRTGTIPVTYDPERKRMLWYYFVVAAMKAEEVKKYSTPQQHKDGMLTYLKGWSAPHIKSLIAQIPSDTLLLSRIYERQVEAGKPWFECCLTGVGDCAHATRPDLAQGGAMAIEDGVELGVYIREAMEEAGKPFGELSPELISAALRKYEIARSHRVAHIVSKSGMIGSMFMMMGYLPKFVMRFTLSRLLQPGKFLEHTVWAPHGVLRRPDLYRSTAHSST